MKDPDKITHNKNMVERIKKNLIKYLELESFLFILCVTYYIYWTRHPNIIDDLRKDIAFIIISFFIPLFSSLFVWTLKFNHKSNLAFNKLDETYQLLEGISKDKKKKIEELDIKIGSTLNIYTKLLNSSENIIERIEGFNYFSPFIVGELIDKNSINNNGFRFCEVNNVIYKAIIENISIRINEKYNATLSGKYLPSWFFKDDDGFNSQSKLDFLKYINNLGKKGIKIRRVMVFNKDELKSDLIKLKKSDKDEKENSTKFNIFFDVYHSNVELYWITPQNLLGLNIDNVLDVDYAILDDNVIIKRFDTKVEILKADEKYFKLFKKLDEALSTKNSRDINGNYFKTANEIKKLINEN